MSHTLEDVKLAHHLGIISIPRLAQFAGVSPSTIYRAFNGAGIAHKTVVFMSDYLEKTLDLSPEASETFYATKQAEADPHGC